ncbi:hypothetical protein [[Eubacterium] cellulosolvens]
MGDSDEVMEMGKKLNMNPLEQKKYKTHIQTIRYNEQKAKAWKMNNYLWQMVFFGALFIDAMVVLVGHLSHIKYIDTSYGDMAVNFISSWFGLLFWFLMPFSFPLMMWTGVVRGKWEGKLTRSTAYALSFLENIEHRQYLEEMAQVRPLQVRAPKRK